MKHLNFLNPGITIIGIFSIGFFAARAAAQSCPPTGCSILCNNAACWDINGNGANCQGTASSFTVTCCTSSYSKVQDGDTCASTGTVASYSYAVCNPGPCEPCDCPTTSCGTQGMQLGDITNGSCVSFGG